jgi:CubicO group peptidase (beta-lactamase class C family)
VSGRLIGDKVRYLPAIAVALLALALAAAAPTARVSAPMLDQRIEAAMAQEGIPGLQAVVVNKEGIIWAKSYGHAVLDPPGPVRPMSNDTMTDSASIAKLIVAIAVLQQVERGRITLDDDIGRSLPFPVRNPAWPGVPITWRMLLTHTSSMETEDDARDLPFTYFGRDPPVALDEFARGTVSAGSPYYWPRLYRAGRPGTERIYSNYAFTVLAVAVEGLVHEPFDAYARHAILAPLKMTRSSYRLAGLTSQDVAVGYASVREGAGHYRFVPARTHWKQMASGGTPLEHQLTCPDYPNGCLHTCALDFARILLMVANHGTVDGARILAPASVELMMTPSGFRNHDGWQQGLGMNGPENHRGRQLWGHDGEDYGTSTSVYFNPESGVGAAVLTNAMDPAWTQTFAVDDLNFHLMSWFE